MSITEYDEAVLQEFYAYIGRIAGIIDGYRMLVSKYTRPDLAEELLEVAGELSDWIHNVWINYDNRGGK